MVKLSIIQSTIFSLLIIINRISIIYFFEKIKTNKINKRILIYGAGEAGLQILNSMKTIKTYSVEGFIDDNVKKLGTKLNNVNIYSYDRTESCL